VSQGTKWFYSSKSESFKNYPIHGRFYWETYVIYIDSKEGDFLVGMSENHHVNFSNMNINEIEQLRTNNGKFGKTFAIYHNSRFLDLRAIIANTITDFGLTGPYGSGKYFSATINSDDFPMHFSTLF